ncbi:GNAT family N-acetyltransferase [Jeotgalibacillus aurantiacus]|uniref:GNAT family N-acetyltransferase n=1 Tax=Jeotgalibacillus aurantiacus TaxID=2763266 RepID=UPI001D0B0041|nr:GNAT family N-acetyltransferase [Jeotgalibacillus aurantiacus]
MIKNGVTVLNRITEENRAAVRRFFEEHWGSSEMVLSSGTYDCSALNGFYTGSALHITGLVTYIIKENVIEVISLDSVEEGRGIGSQLMNKVEDEALSKGIKIIELMTTNDNLHALKFYQRRGYHLAALFPGAVEKAREKKPSIPLMSENGIPIRDEILLRKDLII